MAFDPSKPCQTKVGHKVRILCTDRTGGAPIVGLYADYRGHENMQSWEADGTASFGPRGEDLDLENVPEPVEECWVNVYSDARDERLYVHSTRYEADRNADEDRIACVRVRKGDGL